MKKDNVYLYSRYNGRFEVYQGDVRPTNYSRDCYAQFIFVRNGKESRLRCSPNPGEVYHSVLWLPEKDIDFACEIFIKHEEDAIRALEEKIERHRWNIKRIREDAK